MAFYIDTTQVIDNSSEIIPGKFASRANLPTGAAGYLAYVSDQNEFVSNTTVAQQSGTDPTDADAGVTWYKFLTKPMDYKNEIILAQGTIAGGWIGSGALYRMQQLIYATDSMNLLSQVLPFTTTSGGNHSTPTTAYYHQGGYTGSENSTAKHSWSTYTVTTTNSRPNCFGGYLNSVQPGPKTQNNIGVLLQGSASCYITFATDVWTSGGYDATSTGHGWGSFSNTYGYNWDGITDLYRLAWAGPAWSASGAGAPPNSTDYAKSLNSKWGKLYSSGGTGLSYMDRYDTVSNSWSSNVSSTALTWQDQSTLMGQDWGYYVGYLWSGTYYASSYQLHYPTETITTFAAVTTASYQFNPNLAGGASAASSCTGPLV
jgi:hypothetical protein